MELVEAVERRLHTRNPAFVHARFEPGRCPYCGLNENLRRLIQAKVRLPSPKAVDPS